MDHLFLPRDALPEIFEYPGRSDYIGVPFLEYPILAAKEIFLNAQSGPSSRAFDLFNKDVSQDETKFFTTWLFCGLLQEVLGIALEKLGEEALYRHEDFICTRVDRRNQVLQQAFCTSNLVSLLEQWMMIVGRHEAERIERYEHLRLCINTTHTLMSWESARMDNRLKRLIASTAEMLSIAINSAFSGAGLSLVDIECPDAWSTTILVDEDMSISTANGWCPSDVSEISQATVPFLQALIYRSNLIRAERTGLYKSCPDYHSSSPLPLSNLHATCTNDMCSATRGSPNPQESQSYCTCTSFCFNQSTWNDILRIVDGGICLLRCRRQSTGSYEINVAPFQADTKFVAVSHVWADGLGNPDRNSVLSCRLDCVVDLLFRSRKDVTDEVSTEILFWLDTLCCPLKPSEARKKVLGTMQKIYESAEYVLVLDSELLNVSVAGMTDVEIGWRALESAWMSRLWTLQEGYLAKDLLIVFKDSTFRLDTLADMRPSSAPLNQRHLWTYVKYLYWTLRKSRASATTAAGSVWGLFWGAIRKRRVTVPSDEALCLGTFFGLKIDPIIHADTKDQMRMFWYLIGESNIDIPSGIVFNEQRRVDVDGYRWAPATFLNGKTMDRWFHDPERAMLSKNGLVLSLKGFLLSRTSLSQAHKAKGESPLIKFANQVNQKTLCYVRDQNGTWYSMIPREALFVDPIPPSQNTAQAGSAQIPSSSPDTTFTESILPKSGVQYAAIKQKTTELTLLAVVQGHAGDTRTVKPFRQVVMTKDASFHTPVFEIARAIAHRIACSENFDPFNAEHLTQSIESGARDAAVRLGTMGHPFPDYFTPEKKILLMATHITLILADQHHLDAELLPNGSRWCFQ